MKADGTGLSQLTCKFGDNYHPTWSPEGDKIVLTHDTLGGRPAQIYTINQDGTDITQDRHTNDDSTAADWGSGVRVRDDSRARVCGNVP